MFAEAFIDEGFTVWWDAVLHSGETFDEVIEQRLRDAGAVVVLWSPRSVASRWVRAEATQADRRKKLVPAIIEQCDRPIIFELTHAADLCDWTGDVTDAHWRAFVNDLRRSMDATAREAAATSQPTSPAQEVAHSPTSRKKDDEAIVGKLPEASIGQPRAGKARDLQPENGSDEVHCLEIEESELGDELFVIDSSGVKLGRTAPADIVLTHKSISREHCIIGLASDELLVTDLNSTNGTYIDETRIRRAAILPVGSTLRLGQISLKHSIRTRAEALARANALGGANLQAGNFAFTS